MDSARRKGVFSCLCLCAVLAVGSAEGEAATIAFQDTIDPEFVDLTGPLTPREDYFSGAEDPSGLWSIPQFNPSLGTLTEVTVTLEQDTDVTATFQNQTASGGTFVGALRENIVVSSPFTGWNVLGSLLSLSVVAPDDPCITGVFVESGASVNCSLVAAGSDSFTQTTFLDPNPYVGTGTIEVELSGGSWVNAVDHVSSAIPGTLTGLSSATTGTLTVDYTFDPVPEPGTGALLGLGVVSLGLMRGRKKT